MTDDTIEKTFGMNDWKESDCDVCCGRTGVVLLADQRVCYDCLLNSFDESGDPIITDEELEAAYMPEHRGTILESVNEFFKDTLSDPPRVICIFAIVGLGLGNLIYQLVFVAEVSR